MKIRWFPIAIRDLKAIYKYYEQRNQSASINLYNGILDNVDLLKSNPYMAAIEPLLSEFPQSYRSLVVAKGIMKIIYYIENGTSYIARI